MLCHQDLHGGNILRAEREPWLAIDSKPIVAERAYDAVALIRDARPDARAACAAGSTSSPSGSRLDRERVRLWGIVKRLAWDNARRGGALLRGRLLAMIVDRRRGRPPLAARRADATSSSRRSATG